MSAPLRRMWPSANFMSNRVFILGAGRFGLNLASRLSELGCEVVIGDDNAERVKDLAATGYHALELDATDPDALREVGIPGADTVVVAIGENMQASVLATLLLKEAKVRRVIARAVDDKHAQVLRKVGADEVISPVKDMAFRLAERLRENALGERLPLAGGYLLAEIRLNETLHGKTLAQAGIAEKYGLTVVLSQSETPDGLKVFPAIGSLLLTRGSELLVAGPRHAIQKFDRDCGLH